MFLKIGQFIKGIQHSDDRRKKRWLVIFSGILMIFVIALWVAYLNITLPQNDVISTATSTEAIAPSPFQKEAEVSFFGTLGVGWETVWGSIQKKISDLKNMAGTELLNLKGLFERTNELRIEKPNGGN